VTTLRLNARAAQLARKGRQWFYADDLADPVAAGPGIVRLVDEAAHDHGLAFHSPASRLCVRRCGPWPDGVPPADEFFAARLAAAVELRAGLGGPDGAVRLVHGDADWLPGLVVDRYRDCLVLQSTSAVVEQNFDRIVPWLVRSFEPAMVLARNDVALRRHEGLPEEVRLLHGRRVEPIEIVEGGVRHRVEPFTGHKTGFYLDQAPARARVRQLAAGRRVLDVFSYQGAFSLSALAGGAQSALAIDADEAALARARDAAAAQGWSGLETRAGNAFTLLRELRRDGLQFGLVVLDPPAFCKSRRELADGLRGYRELNRQAVRLLAPGGWLVTASCSHHVTPELFEDVLRQAAAQLPFRVLLRERLQAGPDHPVWLAVPESEYLKVRLLQRT
jgi:23S rRNA (cytosine1962-C5)-methyltransferase